MTTHADLLAAIDNERCPDTATMGEVERNFHLDTLRAILDLHTASTFHACMVCGGGDEPEPWPCPTVQVVADALTRMGVL